MGVQKFSAWEVPPLSSCHDGGSKPEKIFRIASMKNYLLQGFMGESEPFCYWNGIKLLLTITKFDLAGGQNIFCCFCNFEQFLFNNLLTIFRFWLLSWKNLWGPFFGDPWQAPKWLDGGVFQNFACWKGVRPLGPHPHLAQLWSPSSPTKFNNLTFGKVWSN